MVRKINSTDLDKFEAEKAFKQVNPPFAWDELLWYYQFYGYKGIKRGIMKYKGLYGGKRKYEEMEALMRGDEITIYSQGLQEDLSFFKEFDQTFKFNLKDETFKALLDYDFYDVVDSLRTMVVKRHTIKEELDVFLINFLDKEEYDHYYDYWLNFHLRGRMNPKKLKTTPIKKSLECSRFTRVIKRRAPWDERVGLDIYWYQYEDGILNLMENGKF